MDYTLVPYRSEEFELLTYSLTKKSLVSRLSYPEAVSTLEFDYQRAVVGLVLDRRNGYLLQLSRFNKVKTSYFGLDEVSYREQSRLYGNMTVDLRDRDFRILDTLFAISHGVLYAQLVQLKKEGAALPSFGKMEEDIRETIDLLHRDGSLKHVIMKNFPKYVDRDPLIPNLLQRYRHAGKKLMLITNSDYEYTKALLDYAVNPLLTPGGRWEELFDLVITLADKPLFFERSTRFLSIDPDTGLMKNHDRPVTRGIFQGGSFHALERDLRLKGNEILYLGDHIYGDVVSIKKQCNWRTALVLGDLDREMEGITRSQPIQNTIDELMARKEALELQLNEADILLLEGKQAPFSSPDSLYRKIDRINTLISAHIREYVKCFNPYWGQILRAGSEESFYAGQVERFACIYMTRVSDLHAYSPKTYFRPVKRVMPHERAALTAHSSSALQSHK